MKNSTLAIIAVVFLWHFEGNTQTCKAISMNEITATLQKNVIPNVQFTMEKDSGCIHLLNVHQGIGINKSIKKESFFGKLNKKNKGPYIGPIFWIYNFEKISTSTATIQQDSTGTVQLQLHMTKPDTIIINVKKNAHSCVTRTMDVTPHKILWTGKKSITIALKPLEEATKISLKLQYVTIQGFLKREDQFDIAPNFKSDLEKVFVQEFTKVFQNKKLVTVFNEVLKAD
tara:strand:- start:191744 stop:192430 length:687 start_codon:yes stop_codon:yes gene_type:complete